MKIMPNADVFTDNKKISQSMPVRQIDTKIFLDNQIMWQPVNWSCDQIMDSNNSQPETKSDYIRDHHTNMDKET